MAGHSKWAQIKRKKAVTDFKKGASFSKIAREIYVSVREGGPSTDGNVRLRIALERAKREGMTNDTVQRAIDKASGAGAEGEAYQTVIYEGYGPGGIAIMAIALTDNRWLAVQASDGSEAYTRAGDLRVDANGQVRTGSGYAVLGDGGPLSVPPSTSVSIGSDGTVSIVPLGQTAATLASVGRLRVVDAKPADLHRGADGLMRASSGAKLAGASGNVLTTGALESSNVNLADAMVKMISLARQYESQVKLMKSVEDNASASSTLTRIGS